MKTDYKFGEISKHTVKNKNQKSIFIVPSIEGKNICNLDKELYGNKFEFYYTFSKNVSEHGWQEHDTPEFVCDTMIDIDKYDQDKKYVFHNLKILMRFYVKHQFEIIHDNIYFIADTKEKDEFVEEVFPEIHRDKIETKGEKDGFNKFIEKIREITNKMRKETKDKKWHFDVVFTNPPYTRGLDIKLIQRLLDENLADKIIAVQPGAFMYSEVNDTAHKLKATKTIKRVDYYWFNGKDFFDTKGVSLNHAIIEYDKKHNSDQVEIHDHAFTENKEIYNTDEFVYTANVNEINIHSKVHEKANEIKKKFINCKKSWLSEQYKDGDVKTHYGWHSAVKQAGLEETERNYGKFYAFVGNQQKTIQDHIIDETFIWDGKCKDQGMRWYFKSDKELENAINFLKLKCPRFLLSLVKVAPDLTTGCTYQIIPWMDWSKHYSEEDLKKAWGIDEELWDYIDKFIPDYYEDYKEIAK